MVTTMKKIMIAIIIVFGLFWGYVFYYDHPITVINKRLNTNISYLDSSILYESIESSWQDEKKTFLIVLEKETADSLMKNCASLGGEISVYNLENAPLLKNVLLNIDNSNEKYFKENNTSCWQLNFTHRYHRLFIVNNRSIFFMEAIN